MAKKSKTQRAKASAVRAAKKESRVDEELEGVVDEASQGEPEKKSLFAKKDSETEKSAEKPAKEKKPKKEHFKFFKEVKAEMKRVTWPSKQEVLQWSGVVVVALVFFGAYTAILDNAIVTPLLFALSGLAGA